LATHFVAKIKFEHGSETTKIPHETHLLDSGQYLLVTTYTFVP